MVVLRLIKKGNWMVCRPDGKAAEKSKKKLKWIEKDIKDLFS